MAIDQNPALTASRLGSLKLDRPAEPVAPLPTPPKAEPPKPAAPQPVQDSLNLQAPQFSAHALGQMDGLRHAAESRSGGQLPGGSCYEAVWKDIVSAGYGKMPAADIPGEYSRYAKQFAEYADTHLEELGLRKLPITNPYDAPAGALVVVRPGTPGTSHPVAGDITVAMGSGRFLNDGEMAYGGPGNFPAGNNFVLGVYVPR